MRAIKSGHIVALLGVALIATLSALVYASYHRDIQLARERSALGSQIAETPCGQIEYGVIGDGPPVLFVHGAGGGYDQGLEFGKTLAQTGFSIIAMSRFGYLRTPLPVDASAAAQADAHACLLDALGIAAVGVIGGSAGAPSSMQFALRRPGRVTGLVLIVPAAYVPRAEDAPSMTTPAGTEFLFGTALRSDFLFWAAIRFARQTVIRAVLATPPEVVEQASAEEQQRVAGVLEHILPVSPRRSGLLNDAAVTSNLERYDLERILAPTLLLSVADDLFGTFDAAQYSADHIPNARFIGYERGGHLWVGHEQEVMSEIATFLRQTDIGNRNRLVSSGSNGVDTTKSPANPGQLSTDVIRP
jgi:pimeloyl-ACP methyl ester carboxylesterase